MCVKGLVIKRVGCEATIFSFDPLVLGLCNDLHLFLLRTSLGAGADWVVDNYAPLFSSAQISCPTGDVSKVFRCGVSNDLICARLNQLGSSLIIYRHFLLGE